LTSSFNAVRLRAIRAALADSPFARRLKVSPHGKRLIAQHNSLGTTDFPLLYEQAQAAAFD
jgi:hypothetical protein